MNIRRAKITDLSRIAEIYVFNNRINFYPIFKDEMFSFGELQVISMADNYFKQNDIFEHCYVYDDGLIKGFIQLNENEICKCYVEPLFQSKGVGSQLIQFAIEECHAQVLWALEKNARALQFYQKHGFYLTGKKKFEEGTKEYLVELKR